MFILMTNVVDVKNMKFSHWGCIWKSLPDYFSRALKEINNNHFGPKLNVAYNKLLTK
jgi:hypothetical protein